MAEILLFHHALGQTPGFLAFADELRSHGHTVHTPDLFGGRVFNNVDDGVQFAEGEGAEGVIQARQQAAEAHPAAIVYAGFSMGSGIAQALARTRPGAKGVILYSGADHPKWFPHPWPEGLPLQAHVMEHDPWVDPADTQALTDETGSDEVYVYPGNGHLFADPSSPDYEPTSARLLMDRSLQFLSRIG
ncbi:MAG TPA: dienelactone hydrolase family protein [Deinococcales bacterium]|nr:dienelactone hydrolase family protein [Deinococcales bacterium]